MNPSERLSASEIEVAAREFLIVCLCAEWCGVCREFRSGFEEVAGRFPTLQGYWLDIEEHADAVGDLEVENFPTLLIKRRQWVLFYGSMPPAAEHLRRTLAVFLEQSAEDSREYAFSNAERQRWQEDEDLLRLNHAELRQISA